MSERNWHELYFEWLRRQVGVTANMNPKRRHWLLLEQLINTKFEWSVSNDDNRVEDGYELRQEFIFQYSADPGMMDTECSMLEMLIALCRRLSFETDSDPDAWFWELMTNAGLRGFNDEVYEDYECTIDRVDDILRTIIDREYEPNGDGGLFPLKNPDADQTKVELWYQMSAYLLEVDER